jgi:hypothetical protein
VVTGHYAQEVAQHFCAKAVDRTLHALLQKAHSQVRKKLRSTAQLLAHFFGVFTLKTLI